MYEKINKVMLLISEYHGKS